MELYIFALMSSTWFQINDKFASDNIRYFLRYAWTSAVIIVENRSFYVHGHDIPWSRTSTKWLNGKQMTHCMNDINRINGPFEPNKKDDYNHTKKTPRWQRILCFWLTYTTIAPNYSTLNCDVLFKKIKTMEQRQRQRPISIKKNNK